VYKLITAATSEPCVAADLKSQLRITSSSQDTYLGTLLKAARIWAEDYLRFQLVSATWELYLDEFPDSGKCIYIQKSPVTAISSFTYIDSDGDTQTLTEGTDFVADYNSMPCRIYEAYDETWPTPRDIRNCITIRFVAGYATALAVPEIIKQAILIKAATMYENPNEEVSGTQVSQFDAVTAQKLLAPYRAIRF
jgi:uncharacterized phiE125 gp8 family phage protein